MKNIIRTPETHPLTWRLRDDKQPVWLDEYRSKNGYEGARKALTGLSPDEIVNQVKDAGLKGRGGAGFSTGLKWSLMPKDESMNIRYLLCNADEMEPGTYKDRLLMEQLPHLLVEGMLISAFALKAYRGYIFLRGEYIEAAVNLRRAIAEATEAGLLGKKDVVLTHARSHPSRQPPAYGANRPVSTTSKPCVTFRRSSLTAWSGIRTSRKVKMLAPS